MLCLPMTLSLYPSCALKKTYAEPHRVASWVLLRFVRCGADLFCRLFLMQATASLFFPPGLRILVRLTKDGVDMTMVIYVCCSVVILRESTLLYGIGGALPNRPFSPHSSLVHYVCHHKIDQKMMNYITLEASQSQLLHVSTFAKSTSMDKLGLFS
jgi:hypothetical protein